MLQVYEQHEPRLRLDECSDRGLSRFAEDHIAFPATGDRAILNLGWSLSNGDHLAEPLVGS